ncbi:MAG: FMN-binding protein [Acetobacterium woodii]|nr:FMN-binding protein [Acetobacterium woodii]
MSKPEKRKVKKMWIVLLIIIAVIGVGLMGALLADAPGRREAGELVFSDVRFKNLVDGTYVGEFKGEKSHLRDAKVEVTISGGEIANVTILKGAVDKEGKPAKLTGGQDIDDLFNAAIQTQTLQVDVISGATLTSKAHLKALENALKQAQEK